MSDDLQDLPRQYYMLESHVVVDPFQHVRTWGVTHRPQHAQTNTHIRTHVYPGVPTDKFWHVPSCTESLRPKTRTTESDWTTDNTLTLAGPGFQPWNRPDPRSDPDFFGPTSRVPRETCTPGYDTSTTHRGYYSYLCDTETPCVSCSRRPRGSPIPGVSEPLPVERMSMSIGVYFRPRPPTGPSRVGVRSGPVSCGHSHPDRRSGPWVVVTPDTDPRGVGDPGYSRLRVGERSS